MPGECRIPCSHVCWDGSCSHVLKNRCRADLKDVCEQAQAQIWEHPYTLECFSCGGVYRLSCSEVFYVTSLEPVQRRRGTCHLCGKV